MDSVNATSREALESSIASATQGVLGFQQSDGHWVFELEADCTIPAEYVLLRHYLAEPVDTALEAKIGNYLRRVQGAHGGWPLVHDGEFDMSASVKAYFALKMIGDSVDAPHMVRAREAIHARGGAINSNVFTRFMLAMFGVVTWRAVPVLPIEIVLLPFWSPFHLNKISYWARTTMVPLMVHRRAEAAGEESEGRRHRRAVPAGSALDRHDREGAAPEHGLVPAVPRARRHLARGRADVSEEPAQARDRCRARLHRGAAQRRGRHGRDLSADGQHRHDV